ncbi:hypothetical protein [Falsiroseomonas sp. E2-1-a4]
MLARAVPQGAMVTEADLQKRAPGGAGQAAREMRAALLDLQPAISVEL